MLGHGTTILFDSGFLGEILSINWAGIERVAVPNHHFGTTGGKTFQPADTYNPGELVVEIQHDATDTPPLTNVAETVTIEWPTTPTRSDSFSGFMTGYELNATDEEKVRGTARIKASGDITWAAT